MRFHRIELRNYRGVADTTVSLPEAGVTVIAGPNEVGKSSLLEAVQLLFTYRDTSTDARVRSVIPVDGEASPEATVELSTGSYRFTYTKRWHRKHGTTSLTITEPVREQLHGREAHERVEQILGQTLDHGLWDALRFEQGAALDGGGYGGARSLSRALDLAAGGGAEVDTADGLWDRIVAERDRYWYATGKPRAEGVALGRAVAAAEAELADATGDLAALDRLTEEAGALDTAAEALHQQAVGAAERATDLAVRADAAAACRADATAAHEVRNAARAETARTSSEQQQRLELVRRAHQAAEAVTAAELALAEADPRRAEADAALAVTTAALATAHQSLGAAEVANQIAVGDRDHARQRIEVEQLGERLDRVTIAREEAVAATEVLAGNRATAARVAEIEEAHLEVVRATAAAEVSATSVEAVALAAIEVMVDGQRVHLAPEQCHQLAVTGTTELLVPGVARIVVRAGVEAGERAERLCLAEDRLRQRCNAVEVPDLDSARSAAAARVHAAAALTGAEAAIARDRRDLTDGELAQKVARLTERIAAYETSRAVTPPPPADLSAAQEHAAVAEAAFDAARRSVAGADQAHRCADRAHRGADVIASVRATELDGARRAATQEADSLAAARHREGDEQLGEAFNRATTTQARADQAFGVAQTALRQIDPEGTNAALDRARQAEARTAGAHRQNRERRQELRIHLDVRGEEGVARRIDDAATRRQHVERAHAGWTQRAAAARHLHDVFAARRQETRRRYEAPLAERIEEFGRVVFGSSLQVHLDASLAIASRTLHGTTLRFDQLSTGAREQLGLLSRLACATLVDPVDGVPVVLDDVLGWTGRERLAEMGAAIAAAGQSAQVVILTCTPERFAAIDGSVTITLGPEPAPLPTAVPVPATGAVPDTGAASGSTLPPSAGAATERPRRTRRAAPAPDVPTLFPVAERPAS